VPEAISTFARPKLGFEIETPPLKNRFLIISNDVEPFEIVIGT
jgi:hypothetical protein